MRQSSFVAGVVASMATLALVGVHIVNVRTFECPYGAARTPVGEVCLSERDLEVLAERCYLTEACETPGEHAAHGRGGECRLEDAWELSTETWEVGK